MRAPPGARVWDRLLTAVAKRSVRCGRVPGRDACAVLAGVISHHGEVPPQAAFAAELGLDERRLRRALYELGEHGLVLLELRGRRREVVVDVARVKAWAAGELVLEPCVEDEAAAAAEMVHETAMGTKSVPIDRYQNGAYSTSDEKAEGYQNGALSRARAPLAVVVGAASLSDGAQRAGLEEEFSRSLQFCRHAGIKMPLMLQGELRTWLARGLAYEDIEYAAREAASFANPATWRYVQIVLERLLREAQDAAGVVELDQHREPRDER